MPAIQSLKKQLRGIRSTQKLTKAMRTVSTVKFSKLNGLYSGYAAYGRQCRAMLDTFGEAFSDTLHIADPEAPAVVLVMASNKGLCGSFNAEILNFALEKLPGLGPVLLVPCGRKAVNFFRNKKMIAEKEVVFGDVPAFEESSALLNTIIDWRRSGKAARVYAIYPRYVNMMTQEPELSELLLAADGKPGNLALLVPDRDTVVERIAEDVFRAMFYELVLQSALGAQAATLMTMRSAYDTATEYCEELEGQINRLRQSTVTADVIETSVEREDP